MVPELDNADMNEPQPLSRAEIAARQASAATAHERRRWHVIGLAAEHLPLAEIASATGFRPRTIREILKRYRESGADALVDRRAHGPGAPPLLPAALQQRLSEAIQNPPPEGGSWTGPMVARWIAEQTGRRVHRQRGWEYLQRLRGAAEPAQAEAASTNPEAASPAGAA